MSPETRVLVAQLAAALSPLRQRTDAAAFAVASEDASIAVMLTKGQILAANAAIDSADLALADERSSGEGAPPR